MANNVWFWSLLCVKGLDAFVSKNLEHMEFGDLTNFDELFKLVGYKNPTRARRVPVPPKRNSTLFDIDLKSVSQHDMLFKDFEDISKLIPDHILQYTPEKPKILRRYDFFISLESEIARRGVLRNMSYAWIPHIRHRVARAMMLRQGVRADKRFQMGYMFNKLRYLRINQRKIISMAGSTIRNDVAHALTPIARMYQKMQRMDIDIKDMQSYIKAVFNVKMPYDEVRVQAKGKKEPKKKFP